jgi:hypothetical protein
MILPLHEIETFLAIGWQLGDNPSCGAARMFLVVGVHRVSQKMTRRDVCSMPRQVKRVSDNERFTKKRLTTQRH